VVPWRRVFQQWLFYFLFSLLLLAQFFSLLPAANYTDTAALLTGGSAEQLRVCDVYIHFDKGAVTNSVTSARFFADLAVFVTDHNGTNDYLLYDKVSVCFFIIYCTLGLHIFSSVYCI
jgi:hypothetical protein